MTARCRISTASSRVDGLRPTLCIIPAPISSEANLPGKLSGKLSGNEKRKFPRGQSIA
jgi:hypothetical protein